MRRAGAGAAAPVMLAAALYEDLPVETVVDHKPFRLGMAPDGDAILFVQRDLDPDERGARQQRRLRLTTYAPGREEPLRDAVVYTAFGGRQYSDNPRALHEEMVRRELPLEHLWVVSDGMCRVPDTATVVRANSREHYEAMARSRFVVANDHFPDWFERRPDQVGLQTWHGTPLKQLGFDVSNLRNAVRRFERHWDRHVINWQYVLSPNRFTTPILARAYAIEGEMLETGYPRNDVLARADRDARGAEIRARLGLPADRRVVLYAPTFRDDVRDSRGRFRLEQALDIDRLRAAVGDDTVVLYRKHHYCVDPAPATADGFVRDVSAYPDATELMLAADVLVTDYSSMMFDFANTGRPMLFYTYDLDAYRDEIRGFYFDFAERAPGPLLRTTDELAAALAGPRRRGRRARRALSRVRVRVLRARRRPRRRAGRRPAVPASRAGAARRSARGARAGAGGARAAAPRGAGRSAAAAAGAPSRRAAARRRAARPRAGCRAARRAGRAAAW